MAESSLSATTCVQRKYIGKKHFAAVSGFDESEIHNY
jgi:hypothetical protein